MLISKKTTQESKMDNYEKFVFDEEVHIKRLKLDKRIIGCDAARVRLYLSESLGGKEELSEGLNLTLIDTLRIASELRATVSQVVYAVRKVNVPTAKMILIEAEKQKTKKADENDNDNDLY